MLLAPRIPRYVPDLAQHNANAWRTIMHANVTVSGTWKVGRLHTPEAIAVRMRFTISQLELQQMTYQHYWYMSLCESSQASCL